MTPNDYVLKLADEWCKATGRTLIALGGAALNDGKFFSRAPLLPNFTMPTLLRLVEFFRDGDNWPNNRLPELVVDMLDRFPFVSTETDGSSPDNAAELIGARP